MTFLRKKTMYTYRCGCTVTANCDESRLNLLGENIKVGDLIKIKTPMRVSTNTSIDELSLKADKYKENEYSGWEMRWQPDETTLVYAGYTGIMLDSWSVKMRHCLRCQDNAYTYGLHTRFAGGVVMLGRLGETMAFINTGRLAIVPFHEYLHKIS